MNRFGRPTSGWLNSPEQTHIQTGSQTCAVQPHDQRTDDAHQMNRKPTNGREGEMTGKLLHGRGVGVWPLRIDPLGRTVTL